MRWALVWAACALLAIGLALAKLHEGEAGVTITARHIGDIPATVYRPAAPLGPVVVVAHGFAGSQVLMQPFALALARNGYIAVTFDFPGHGRNPNPLTGDITKVEGATQTLVAATEAVAAVARTLGTGLAVLGHSMASDIIVRFAEATPDVRATIALSMFSPAVTPTAPRNLLVIVGDWEAMLKAEALRAVALAAPGAQPFVTYGDPAAGTGRRAAFSRDVEHVAVLYAQAGMREAVAWLDATFGVRRATPAVFGARGPWIVLLLGGIVLLAWPLARALPVVSPRPLGAAQRWRRLWLPLLLPALATPLLLRVVPTHFLPVIVGDYLAVHFAVYGAMTAACLVWQRASAVTGWTWRLAVAAAAMTVYAIAVFGGAIDRTVTSFVPGGGRVVLIAAMLAGTLPYFLADEWMTRGGARGAYAASKAAFLVSLALAVALDFQRLFFLAIIVPVVLVFFLIYGAFSAWAYRRTGHPFVAGLANAAAFAWAIGVTFPLLAG